MKRILIYTSFVLLGAWTWPSSGQELASDPVISTDRPSVGTGPDLATPGWFIVENGISVAGRGGNTTVDLPESLMRYGVSKRVELRVGVPNMEQVDPNEGFEREDGSISAKIGLRLADHWPVSSIVTLSMPVGSQRLSSGGWDPALLLTTSHTWTPRLSSFASANAAWVSQGSSGRREATQFALDGLWKLNDAVTVYLEWAPLVYAAPEAFGYTAETGAMWIIAKRTQLDTRVGATVTSTGVTAFAGLGYSFSFHRAGFARN